MVLSDPPVRVAPMAHAYSRHPHVHADQIVFVADDDLWLVPTSGGRASRLTSDRTPVAYPWFSPDGRKVAWGSTRDGGWDAHVLDLDTGERHRLTHLSAARAFRVAGWLGDRVLVHRHPDALHDVFASPAPVRETAMEATFRWLGAYAPPRA